MTTQRFNIDGITGKYAKVTCKGRSHVGEVVSANDVVVILDGPVSTVTIPTAIITKIEVQK